MHRCWAAGGVSGSCSESTARTPGRKGVQIRTDVGEMETRKEPSRPNPNVRYVPGATCCALALCPEAPGSAEAEAGAPAGTAGGQRGRRGRRGRSPAPGVRDGRAPGGGLRGPERARPGRPKDAGSSEWRVEPPFSERRVTEGRTDSPVLHTLDLGCLAFKQHYQAGAAARAWRARECWRSGGSMHPTRARH